MKTINTIAVLVFAFLAPPGWAATITVTVMGLADTDPTGAHFTATDGVDLIQTATVDYTPRDTEIPVYVPTGEYDPDTGEEIYRTEYQYEFVLADQVTTYTVTIPDLWIGRSLSFSWDTGGAYTPFTPVLREGQTFTFQSQALAGNGQLPGEANGQPDFDVMSNRLLIGKWWDNGSRSLLNLQAWDNVDPSWPAMGMDLLASRPNSFWRWMHPTDNGQGLEFAMDLDYQHRLTLRRRNAPGQRIILDPETGQISINGQAVLTATSGALQFAARSADNPTMGTDSSASTYGVAIGRGANSSTSYSVALGYGAKNLTGTRSSDPDVASHTSATDYHAIAIGENSQTDARGAVAVGRRAYAAQDLSTALGGYSTAQGIESLAAGHMSMASQQASVALGAHSRAAAPKSAALGYRLFAIGYGQTVVGVNNVPVGNSQSPTDPQSEVFVVGAGSYEYSGDYEPANAFTVKRNGDTKVFGALSVNGPVRVPQSGDLSMGEFQAVPQP